MFTHVRQDTIAGKDVLSRGTPMTAASRYPDIYARWARDPEGFWGEAASAIDWIEKPKKIFDKDAGIYGRWFTGGTCNTCTTASTGACGLVAAAPSLAIAPKRRCGIKEGSGTRAFSSLLGAPPDDALSLPPHYYYFQYSPTPVLGPVG